MPDDPNQLSKRVLEPNERIAEILFGLIMVLTFTGSLSVAEAGREDVRVMLIGALGCNIAWGIIDGILYLMGSLATKGRNLITLRSVLNASDPKEAQRLIANALPSPIVAILQPGELESMHQRLQKLPPPAERARLNKTDWLGALGVFLLVFFTTFPVAVPFIFVHNATVAMRASNGIAVGMLFIAGFMYGRYVGRSAWGFGVGMVFLGTVLVAITIALGG